MGYKVKVVHLESLFPRLFYWVGRCFVGYIQAKTGCVAYTNTPRKKLRYEVEGVPVMFVPIAKILPHSTPSRKKMEKAKEWIVRELESENFIPDVITAHFILPQLEMAYLLKQQYPMAHSCMVLHGGCFAIQTSYPKSYKELMAAIDVWGFRSQAFMNDFENIYGLPKKRFICYSGIPNKYLAEKKSVYAKNVRRFVFTGSLYALKNVDITIRALHKALGNSDYTFDIVGGGAEEKKLRSLVKELNMESCVVFHGQMKRDDAQKVISNADVFVMVSAHEAFGLVYVEAMAKGLIVIGTKGQGIDGVVRDGENGFLCEANNINALAKVVGHICSMPAEQRQKISDNARATAEGLTDKKAADMYIKSIV